ncbi:ribosomal protein S3 (mitochondrion) [Quercus suber]|uniref:Ribosomal protein S3 n=1 Tax=Quercus suber TaxID=58331 RepID=A0AAW0I5B6_QUESU
MARKGNPISVRLGLNRSSDSSRFSIYYYGKSVYQDVNLRSYFGSIRPPTRLTFGFRLGRCFIIHFPKRTFIHFFLPRRPRLLKRREKSRPGKEKGRWWAFGKVGPIGCLHSSGDTEEERNEVRGRGQGKESSRSGSTTGRSKTKLGFGRKRSNAMDTMTDHH